MFGARIKLSIEIRLVSRARKNYYERRRRRRKKKKKEEEEEEERRRRRRRKKGKESFLSLPFLSFQRKGPRIEFREGRFKI